MIRISDLESITDKTDVSEIIPKIMQLANPVLNKRQELQKKYSRDANDSNLMYSSNADKTIISYEKFLTDISAGYLSGKPVYTIVDNGTPEKQQLISNILDTEMKDNKYKDEMKILMDYISDYNDDETEHHDLVHDILELTSCYEVLYENEFNEVVYSKYNPLNTIALWDYSTPANLIAIVRVWDEKDINEKISHRCEVTDKFGTKTYSVDEDYKEVSEIDINNHNWGDVPAIAVETDYAIFEPCEDVISAFEQLIQNVRNTYQYNDSDCKLKFTNYMTDNPLFTTTFTTDENGNEIEKREINEDRVKEDEYVLKSKTLYVGEGGNVDWIVKPLDSNGAVEILKVYTNLMFQLAGIPNTSDLAFNSTDLNASAIDRKFYIMNMMTSNIISELKKAYLRRWELIFNRINLKKNTKYDFRDIRINLPKNLPANDDEKIDSTLKKQGIISEQTIIEELGYNYLDEKNKKDIESQENILTNIENMKLLQDSGVTSEEATEEREVETEEV